MLSEYYNSLHTHTYTKHILLLSTLYFSSCFVKFFLRVTRHYAHPKTKSADYYLIYISLLYVFIIYTKKKNEN